MVTMATKRTSESRRAAAEILNMRWELERRRKKRRKHLTRAQDESLKAFLAQFMMDEALHACIIVDGPERSANAMGAFFRGMAATTKRALIKGAVPEQAVVMMNMAENMSHPVVVACAWDIVTGEGWQRTLMRVSAQLPPGETLPPNTTADMVLNFLDFPEPEEPVAPEDKQVTIKSHLPEEEHQQVWKGSSREKTGTVRELLGDFKLAGMRPVAHDGETVTLQKD